MLMIFFSVVYFVVFFFLIDFAFRNTSLSLFTNLLGLVCLIIAFIVSVGMAEYTVKKIKDK